jgi:hypothetical protein
MNDREIPSGQDTEGRGMQDTIWYAPLRPAKFRLLDGLIPEMDNIFSTEVYQEIADPSHVYARINLTPQDTCLRTVIIGIPDIIDRYARYDHKLLVPFENNRVELGGEELISVDSLRFVAPQVFRGIENLHSLRYFIRPSSFALSRVSHRVLFGKNAKISTWSYRLGGYRRHEFFSHIQTEEESSWLLPFCRALLTTNSQTYIWSHPELDYSLLHPTQSGFMSEFI